MEDNQPTDETMSEGSPSGTEASTTSSDSDGVSPEFIKMSQALVMGATPAQIQYVQQCCADALKSHIEGGANEADDSQGPSEYSSDDMPKD